VPQVDIVMLTSRYRPFLDPMVDASDCVSWVRNQLLDSSSTCEMGWAEWGLEPSSYVQSTLSRRVCSVLL
jgi:hypothetical protein